jgi:hypothetical protein
MKELQVAIKIQNWCIIGVKFKAFEGFLLFGGWYTLQT